MKYAPTLITDDMLSREFSRVLRDVLGMSEYPPVHVEITRNKREDSLEIEVAWRSGSTKAGAPMEALALSLDDFCDGWVLPMVSELCGRPLLDEGRIVVNPVHDEREAA